MKKIYLQLLFVITTFLLSVYISLPNFIEDKNYLLSNKLNLGLDIRGGISLVIEADLSTHEQEQMFNIKQSIVNSINKGLELKKSLTSKISGNSITFESNEAGLIAKIQSVLDGIMSSQFYEINTSEDNIVLIIKKAFFKNDQNSLIERIIEVIRYRIDATGVQEITIQRQGESSILVQIPGASDRSAIKNILSQTGSLKIHLVDMNITNQDIIDHNLPLGIKVLPMMKDKDESSESQIIQVPIMIQPVMSGEMIADAYNTTNMGKHIVNFKLTDAGTRKFAEVTKNNVGNALAIVLDNKIITAPIINEVILTGSGQISGSFSFESAKQIAILLRSGSLPVPVKIVQESLIGPTLGREAVSSGANAVIIGCLAVILIMIGFYRALGFIASVGLICNLTLMLAVLSLIEATLTLPGIAGIALTLGMAVDANVLIYERMREENHQNKKSVLQTIKKGYDKALRTILDSNITTVIVALLLYVFGSSTIKGFAVTLIIGIICSMITAVIFTKVLIELWYDIAKPKDLKL
jgi:preprotein translocase subunit SecD